MIRINLLNQLDKVPEKKSIKTGDSSSFKRLVVIFLFLVIIAGLVFTWYQLSGKGKEEQIEAGPRHKTSVPQKPEYKPKVVLSQAVEEIVKEIQTEQRKAPRNTTYRDLSPAEKIEHQLSTCKKALAFFGKITPPEIGFTDIILTTPGDLYLHGMATGSGHYQTFKQSLSHASFLTVKPGILKPTGAHNLAQEFSFYGTFRFKIPSPGGNRIVSPQDVSGTISRFRRTAKASGLQLTPLTLKSKTNVGKYRRYIYETHIRNCSFDRFQNFITKLYVSKAKTGILKFSLKAEGDDILAAGIDLVLYTN